MIVINKKVKRSQELTFNARSVEEGVALCYQKQELGDSLHGFLQYGLCLVAKYRDIFPPTPSATPKLHRLLRYTWL